VDGHLTLDILLAKYRGKLDAAQNETISRHLAECEHCKARNEFVPDLEKLLRLNRDRQIFAAHPKENCLGDHLIQNYAKGKLSFFEKRKVETHLANCSDCRRVLVAISLAPADSAVVEQISEEDKVLLAFLPSILPSERLARAHTQLAEEPPLEPSPAPMHRRKHKASPWEGLLAIFNFKRRPALAAAAVGVLVAGLAFGWNRATNWRSNVWAQHGMDTLIQQQPLTESDLRPSGNFELPVIGKSRRDGQQAAGENPADEFFQNSLKWNSANRQALHGLALSAYFAGKLMRADSLLQWLLAADSHAVDVWNDLGVVAHRRGEAQSALKLFENALQLEPQFAEATFNLARVLEESGRIDEARQVWQKYVALDSASAWADVAKEHLAGEALP
jgi:tetratricopeptide (TPR) repeat protein